MQVNKITTKPMRDKAFWMYQIHLTQVVLWHSTIYVHVKHKTLKDLMKKSWGVLSAILRLMTDPKTEEYITEQSAQISDSLYELSFLDDDLLHKASVEFSEIIDKYSNIQKSRKNEIQAN